MNKDFESAFNELGLRRNIQRKTKPTAKRNYDVKITLNKNGEKSERMSVRFGFINNAFNYFKDWQFVQASSVESAEKLKKDRIYFLPSIEQKNGSNKICKNPKSSSSCCYTFVPTAQEEKIYRTKWANYTFKLEFDDNHGGLPYIEKGEERR